MTSPFQQPFANRILSNFDIWENILAHSSLAEHLPLAGTCHLLNNTMRLYAEHRLYSMIQPFGLDPVNTRDLLRKTNSVISGSFALCYIFGTAHTKWRPDDIDMYVTHEGLRIVLGELYDRGYTEQEAVLTSSFDYDGNEIERIIHVTDSVHKIDIIVSRTASPIAPLFQFHSTLVMNYISADSFFSAYPSLTIESVGLINPLIDFRKQLTPSTLLSINKYRQRGYRLRAPSAFWLIEKMKTESFGHLCRTCTRCPYTKRSNKDSGCLLAAIDAKTSTSGLLRHLGVQRKKVTWLLATERCDKKRTYRLIHPYITVFDDIL